MKLTKMLAVCAVTVTAIAAMAMSASAEFSAVYVAPTGDATGTVTLSDLSSASGDHTLLVLNNDVFGDFTDEEVGTVTVSADDIVQIDQAATFDTVAVGDLAAGIDAANQALLDAYAAITDPTAEDYDAAFANWTASQTYYVRVGGGSTIDTAQITAATTVTNTYTRPEETPDEPETPKWHLGNVDLSGNPYETDMEAAASEVTSSDALLVLYGAVGNADAFTEEQLEYLQYLGDVNGIITDYENEYPTASDALAILYMVAGEVTATNEKLVTYYYGEL